MRALSVAAVLVACSGDVIPLSRQFHDHFVTDCTGGINQQAELSGPNECSDALNVWAPNGRVETRPGYVGIDHIAVGTTTTTIFFARAEDTSSGTFSSPDGTGVLTLSNLVGRVTSGGDMDRWYIGHSSTFNSIYVVTATSNSNATRYKAEYWNGSEWKYLRVNEFDNDTGGAVSHLGGSHAGLTFAAPQDWATTTVDSQSAYWIRFNLLDANFDASVSIDVDHANTTVTGAATVVGLFAPQYPSSKRYIVVGRSPSSVTYYIDYRALGIYPFALGFSSANILNEPASMAVVPQFEESFIAYGWQITRHKAAPSSDDSITAQVETADYAVGDDAPYDSDLLAQLSVFPQAKYIQFFKGHLWVANLLGSPYEVRWGAPAPYHKVWPTDSYEILAEHDNSPITGMHPLGEFMVIFKQDSIWMAYDAGIDAFGLQQYAIRQVVNGVGCVSNSSIKAIRGQLLFLAEDGVYAFDGANVQKLSDNVQDTIASINPGRRPFASAAHWRTRSCYLLSFSTEGTSENDTTLVFDYKNSTWWIWDNIDAQHWLEDEGSYDQETLYFGDSSGRIYQFGVGTDDHGAAIEDYVLTQRIGMRSGQKRRARSVEVCTTNRTRNCTVELLSNDESSGTSGTLSFTDATEADWDDFSYASGATTDDNWVSTRRRLKRLDFRKEFDWVQVKVSHSEKNQPMQLAYIDVGLLPISARSR